MSNDLRERLAALPDLTHRELNAEYRRVYSTDPPPTLSSRLLRLAIAYRLQEKDLGGLSKSLRNRLSNGKVLGSKKINSGAVLIREWHGAHHRVLVHDDHFEYLGQRFRSLTAVAGRITGSHRSGIDFFGLASRRHD